MTLYPICSLCNELVELETTNTDENGKAVHEECYVAYVASRFRVMISTGHALSTLCSLRAQRDKPFAA
jgi:hypothetical protein